MKITNKEIEELQYAIAFERNLFNSTITELSSKIKESAINQLKLKGIKIGDMVNVVSDNRADIKKGILSDIIVDKYGDINPIINKITKTGKPHSTQTIFVWYDSTIEKCEDK